MSIEKYPSHLTWYTVNILEPIFNKKDKFPNTENTTIAKKFLFATASTTNDIISDTANKKSVIKRSTLGLPKNILFPTTPA